MTIVVKAVIIKIKTDLFSFNVKKKTNTTKEIKAPLDPEYTNMYTEAIRNKTFIIENDFFKYKSVKNIEIENKAKYAKIC